MTSTTFLRHYLCTLTEALFIPYYSDRLFQMLIILVLILCLTSPFINMGGQTYHHQDQLLMKNLGLIKEKHKFFYFTACSVKQAE